MLEPKQIGKNIRLLRETRDMSQEELADKLCVTRKAVSAWETGRAVPRAGAVQTMSIIFKCSMRDILEKEFPFDVKDEILSSRIEEKAEEVYYTPDQQRILTICKALPNESQQRLLDYAIKLLTEGK